MLGGNEAILSADLWASQLYGWIEEKARADACGECLDKCPQGIDIPERMKVVHEALGPD